MSSGGIDAVSLSSQRLLLSIANDEYLSASVTDGGFRLNPKGNSLLEAETLQVAFQNLVSDKLVHVASQDSQVSPKLVAFQPTTEGLRALVNSYRMLPEAERYQPGKIVVIPDTQPLGDGWELSDADIIDVDLDCVVGTISFATYRDAEDFEELEMAFHGCPFEGYESLSELTSIAPAHQSLNERIALAIESPLQIVIFDHLRIESRYLGAGVGVAALRFLMNDSGPGTLFALTPFPLNYTFITNDHGFVSGLRRLQCLYESMGFSSFHPKQTIMIAFS